MMLSLMMTTMPSLIIYPSSSLKASWTLSLLMIWQLWPMRAFLSTMHFLMLVFIYTLVPSSDDGSVRDDAILDDDDNAVLDNISLLLLEGLLDIVLVDDLAVVADARVLVHDALLDDGAVPDTDGHAPGKELALLHGLIVVRSHDESLLDDGVGSDQAPEADHAVGDLASVPDDAPVANDAVGDLAVDHLRGREEPGHGVNRELVFVKGELELVPALAEGQVALVKGLDVHADGVGPGNHLAAKVVRLRKVLGEEVDHGAGLEDVDSHRGDVRHLLGPLLVQPEDGGVHHHLLQSIALGLLGEGQGRDGDVRPAPDVRLHKVAVVHPVEVVPAQNQVVLDPVPLRGLEEPQVLPHGVGRALEPLGVRGALLGGEDLHKAAAAGGAAADDRVVGLGHVPVQTRRVELGEAVHLVDPAVDAVAHGDVDEAVVRAEGNGGFRPLLREGVEPGSGASPQDDAEDGLLHISLVHDEILLEAGVGGGPVRARGLGEGIALLLLHLDGLPHGLLAPPALGLLARRGREAAEGRARFPC